MTLETTDQHTVLSSLRPMSEFVDLGFLYVLNRDYFNPKGFAVFLYIDDVNGQTSLGWGCLPIEVARDLGVFPTLEGMDQREAAFDAFEC